MTPAGQASSAAASAGGGAPRVADPDADPNTDPGSAPHVRPDRHSSYTPGRRIVLWRHGQTAWNLENRLQGQSDIPLDEVGHAQAAKAARLLAALRPQAIVSSDLIRAADTAQALAGLVKLPVTLDKGLRETYVGAWQGLTDAEIKAKFPEEEKAWRADRSIRRGGGEIESDVVARAVPAINAALESLPARGTLVVVSHGGTIRVAIGGLLGLPPAHWGALGGLSNCCWSVLGEGHSGWRLLEHNAGSLPEPVMGDDK
ncbi:MAG TPA: histidine phosphatase family protein [Actinocrinis sp.]|nr:histidine phosphatase family protein [Actinocrinis sp.]